MIRKVVTIALTLAIALTALPAKHAMASNYWAVGSLVGLSAGTKIRQGPGLSYSAHTTVPENNWTVKVIGGALLCKWADMVGHEPPGCR